MREAEEDHQRLATSFGDVAVNYDRGRPGYPSSAIAWLLGTSPLDVVDLGAGTGKLTAALVDAGHRVIAVEPLAQMRAVLSKHVPEAGLVAGTAEDTGLGTRTADAVVAGSAFHWFDHARALPEIARVLRPGGTLGVLGNEFDESVPWVASLRGLLQRGRERRDQWPSLDALEPYFSDVESRSDFRFTHPLDRARLRDLAQSRSRVATLAPEPREQLLARVDGLWDSEPELQDRDRAELPYLTHVLRARGSHR